MAHLYMFIHTHKHKQAKIKWAVGTNNYREKARGIGVLTATTDLRGQNLSHYLL